MMRLPLQVIYFLSIVAVNGQLSPTWPTTWLLNRSTILMVCNTTGPVSVDVISHFHLLDFDWSTMKQLWAKDKPMTAEEALYTQGLSAHTAQPDAIIGTYRNSVKALPWFTSVRVKLSDPAYAKWFLPFGPPTVNGTEWHVPACDNNYNPPLCSALYHDQTQTPGFPTGDGNCDPPACDVGGVVPVGEYLFDPRSAGLEINNQTLLQWFVNDYLFGPLGGGAPFVSFFFLDDEWTPIGPSEVDNYAIFDLGLTLGEVETIFFSYLAFMVAVQAAIIERGAFSWQLFYTDELRGIWGNSGAGPLVGNLTCAADLRILCSTDSPTQRRTIMYGFTMGATGKLSVPLVDIANFQLIRGESAFLGHGWTGCDNSFEWPSQLDGDYGEPEGLCAETATGSGIFLRNFTKSTISMNCMTGQPELVMH
jgi:hypothetical protein